jgi:hypothetical protein
MSVFGVYLVGIRQHLGVFVSIREYLRVSEASEVEAGIQKVALCGRKV